MHNQKGDLHNFRHLFVPRERAEHDAIQQGTIDTDGAQDGSGRVTCHERDTIYTYPTRDSFLFSFRSAKRALHGRGRAGGWWPKIAWGTKPCAYAYMQTPTADNHGLAPEAHQAPRNQQQPLIYDSSSRCAHAPCFAPLVPTAFLLCRLTAVCLTSDRRSGLSLKKDGCM